MSFLEMIKLIAAETITSSEQNLLVLTNVYSMNCASTILNPVGASGPFTVRRDGCTKGRQC